MYKTLKDATKCATMDTALLFAVKNEYVSKILTRMNKNFEL